MAERWKAKTCPVMRRTLQTPNIVKVISPLRHIEICIVSHGVRSLSCSNTYCMIWYMRNSHLPAHSTRFWCIDRVHNDFARRSAFFAPLTDAMARDLCASQLLCAPPNRYVLHIISSTRDCKAHSKTQKSTERFRFSTLL